MATHSKVKVEISGGPIVIERPISLKNAKTIENFNRALDKAKLIYDDIVVDEDFQCAILSNIVAGVEKSNVTLLYTSSLDKKVHSRTVNCDYASFGPLHKKGHILIGYKPDDDQISNIGGFAKYAMLKHNGYLVVPPGKWLIKDIQEKFLLTESYLGKYITDANSGENLYTYSGKLVTHLEGSVYQEKEMKLHGLPVNIIIQNGYVREEGKIPTDEILHIYLVYKGEIYLAYKENTTGKFVDVIGNRVMVKTTIGARKSLVEFEPADIILPENKINFS